MSREEGTLFKVLLIGNAEVGKTAIVNAWANSAFNPTYEPTVSPQPTQCTIGDQIRLEVWDLGFAQLDSDKQLSTYANGAAAALLVYDCNSESSAASVAYWHEKIQGRMASDCLFVVVGSKADKLDASGAAIQRAKSFAAVVGAQHTDVSARTGANVGRLFETLARALAAKAAGRLNAPSKSEVDSPGDLDTTTHTVQTIADFIVEAPAVPTDSSMAISWPLGAAPASSPMESAVLKLSRTWTRPCKLVLLGDAGAGKTCIARSLAGIGKEAGFVVDDYVPTAGLEMMTKHIDPDGASIKLQIWDAGGSELSEDARLRSAVLQGFDVAAIIYDVSSRASFASISTWFKFIEEMHKGSDSVVILLGNNGNLANGVISESDGNTKAEALGVPFAELSSRSENQVTNLIHSLFGVGQNRSAASLGALASARHDQAASNGKADRGGSPLHRSMSPPQPQEPRQQEPLPRRGNHSKARSSVVKPTESETRTGYVGSTMASKSKESAEPVDSEIRRGNARSLKLKDPAEPTESEIRKGYMGSTVASKSKESAEITQVAKPMERAIPRSNHGTSVQPSKAGLAAASVLSNSQQMRQSLQPQQQQRLLQTQQAHAQPVQPLRQLQQLQQGQKLQQPASPVLRPRLPQQHDQGPSVVPQWDRSPQSSPQPRQIIPQRSMSPRPVHIVSPRQEVLQQSQQQAPQQVSSPSFQFQTHAAHNDPLSNSMVRLSWQPGMRSASPERVSSAARSGSPQPVSPLPPGPFANPMRFPGLAAMELSQGHMFLPPQMPGIAVEPFQARAGSPPPSARHPSPCGQRRPEPLHPMTGIQRGSFGRSSTFAVGVGSGDVPQGYRSSSPSPPPGQQEPMSADANRFQSKMQCLAELENAAIRSTSPVRSPMRQDLDKHIPQGKNLQSVASYHISQPAGNIH
eukprot:TRINITY_DN41761_c0_g1_i1.p1 TRINITY_DN41761_c0_g1~~TRINITY_DN41761_c0_g1_i1.p1  ORF type:complete len:919 (+),score=145.78 TRINITY_DN41761_c0_g1_i1:178-2934(+)